MNRKEYVTMTKAVNALYDYVYLTEGDLQRIDHIDEEIYSIDKNLFNIVINKNDDSIGSIIKNGSNLADENGNRTLKLISGVLEVLERISPSINRNNGNRNVPLDKLNKRKQLVLERTEIIGNAKERMKNNNPEQYETITNMINQQRIEMKNGTFDLASFIVI